MAAEGNGCRKNTRVAVRKNSLLSPTKHIRGPAEQYVPQPKS